MKVEQIAYDDKAKRVSTDLGDGAVIVFTYDDDTELHVNFNQATGTVSVRSGGTTTGRLVLHPVVSNEIQVTIERHLAL